MPSHLPISPLLLPYLSWQSNGSLTLLTGTLGATTSWLVLQLAAASLKSEGMSQADECLTKLSPTVGKPRVILMSCLQDANFWKDGGRKLGVDFQNLTFIDMFSNNLGSDTGTVADLEEKILQATSQANVGHHVNEKILLVLDGLDFLLAIERCSMESLLDTIDSLRNYAHSTVITASADSTLLHIHASSTPLEIAHASFVVSLAHQATRVMSLRELDTGGSRDISGVLRITRGGCGEWDGGDEAKEMESLYCTVGDGSVRVFERGS